MKLSVQFQGEEGIDAGGVSREWYQVSCLPTPFLSSHDCLRLKGPLGMRVFATPSTPKLMHVPQNYSQSIDITVVAAEAAASVSSQNLTEGVL